MSVVNLPIITGCWETDGENDDFNVDHKCLTFCTGLNNRGYTVLETLFLVRSYSVWWEDGKG